MDKDYKDVVENTAYHTLTYLREKLNIDNEFIKGWKDGLIGGREIYYVGILNSEPFMERVNPMYFSFDKMRSFARKPSVEQCFQYKTCLVENMSHCGFALQTKPCLFLLRLWMMFPSIVWLL